MFFGSWIVGMLVLIASRSRWPGACPRPFRDSPENHLLSVSDWRMTHPRAEALNALFAGRVIDKLSLVSKTWTAETLLRDGALGVHPAATRFRGPGVGERVLAPH